MPTTSGQVNRCNGYNHQNGCSTTERDRAGAVHFFDASYWVFKGSSVSMTKAGGSAVVFRNGKTTPSTRYQCRTWAALHR